MGFQNTEWSVENLSLKTHRKYQIPKNGGGGMGKGDLIHRSLKNCWKLLETSIAISCSPLQIIEKIVNESDSFVSLCCNCILYNSASLFNVF